MSYHESKALIFRMQHFRTVHMTSINCKKQERLIRDTLYTRNVATVTATTLLTNVLQEIRVKFYASRLLN